MERWCARCLFSRFPGLLVEQVCERAAVSSNVQLHCARQSRVSAMARSDTRLCSLRRMSRREVHFLHQNSFVVPQGRRQEPGAVPAQQVAGIHQLR